MGTLNLVSAIPPSVNHYLGRRNIIKDGRPVSISYKKKEAVDYAKVFAAHIAEEVQRQGWAMDPNPYRHYYVDATFYFPRMRMDSNNCWKLLLDTITQTQMVWLDDDLVCERVQGIFYDTVNPHVELSIHPVDYIGVFQDEEQLQQFTAQCSGCTRGSRNCRILQKAMCGKIQEEVSDGSCSKYKPTVHEKKED